MHGQVQQVVAPDVAAKSIGLVRGRRGTGGVNASRTSAGARAWLMASVSEATGRPATVTSFGAKRALSIGHSALMFGAVI